MVLSLLSVAAAGYSTAPVPAVTRAASPAMMAKSKVRFYPPRTARRVAEIRRNLRLRRCSPPLSRVQVAPMFDAPGELKGYVGEEDGFDPLKLSTFFDMVRRRPGAAAIPGTGSPRGTRQSAGTRALCSA